MARRPPRTLVKAATALARFLYRASGGRIGGRVGKARVLLLTTTGRKSGRPRTTPLAYLEDGERLILIASFGGADVHPAWFLNLRESTRVEVKVGHGPAQKMRAREATPEERKHLWPRVTGMYAGYAKYQKKTAREIPLVILEAE